MNEIGLVGLVKLEFPDGDVRLCDGAFFTFNAELYKEADATFGSIGSVEALSEGVGDEVPALQMTLLPPGSSEPADLQQVGMQRSRVRFWIGEYIVATGAISGTPDLMFDGQLDQSSLEVDATERRLAVSVVSTAERLFERNSGNSLNPVFHKAIWPGELGHDNATGLGIPVAWGTTSPSAGGVSAGGGAYAIGAGAVGYGGGGLQNFSVLQ